MARARNSQILRGKKSKRFLFTRIIRRDNNTHTSPRYGGVLRYFSCFLVGVLNTTRRHSGEHGNRCCHAKASFTNEHDFLMCKFDREKCTRFEFDANYYGGKNRLFLLASRVNVHFAYTMVSYNACELFGLIQQHCFPSRRGNSISFSIVVDLIS